MRANTLLIVPSLDVSLSSDGRVRLTEKFVSGMQMYLDNWDGTVELLAQRSTEGNSGNLDDIWVKPSELPFKVTVADFTSDEALATIARSAVVQGGTDHRLNHVPRHCHAHGVKYVLVSEYTLQTRWQIIDADNLNPVVAWRRKMWAWRQERANMAAARAAAAVHCNGTPTYDKYKGLNERTLLFFDSRVLPEMLPNVPTPLERKAQSWSTDTPIRLAFSGRLNAMKGADHLVEVAKALQDSGVPFTLDIYGDGPLVPDMKQAIAQHSLQDVVRLGGVLDFSTELMPRIREEVDLFVCCHRQGDPSCTYLETMACGVPIVGYANEAFAGLMRLCPAGVDVPCDDVAAMAIAVKQLAREPHRLAQLGRQGLDFARKHVFQTEFRKRIAHMDGLLSRSPSPDARPARH